MERVLTVEVNLNLKADESLQQIVAYIFGQKLTADNERNPQPTEQPNPEPQPATEQPAETEAKPKRTRSKKTDPAPATDPQPAETEQPAADPEPQKPLPSVDEVAAAVEAAAEQGAEARAQVSLEEVKQVFFQKLAGHRDEIRSKINELGAPSLSTIEAAKLPEMLNFLKSLD